MIELCRKNDKIMQNNIAIAAPTKKQNQKDANAWVCTPFGTQS